MTEEEATEIYESEEEQIQIRIADGVAEVWESAPTSEAGDWVLTSTLKSA